MPRPKSKHESHASESELAAFWETGSGVVADDIVVAASVPGCGAASSIAASDIVVTSQPAL